MRVIPAVVAALAAVAAGCGSSHDSARRSSTSAASLVPADASTYLSVGAKRDFPGRDVLVAQLPVTADEVDVARVGAHTVAFTREKPSRMKRNYTIRKIGDWYAVADSAQLFDRVRTAQNGTSLADTSAFKRAWAKLDSDAVARLYGANDRTTGQAVPDGGALRIRLSSQLTAKLRVGASPLLRDVPSGAALAVSFRGGDALAKRVPMLAQLAPLLRGDGILYVRPAGLVPQVAIELASPNPQATLARVRSFLDRRNRVPGLLLFTATISAGKVVIFDGPPALEALRTGSKLVDDTSYKDAIGAAGVPSRTALFAYADMPALAPFIEVWGEAGLGKPLDPATSKNLEHLGTVVAWVTSTGSGFELHAWLRPH